MSATKSRHLTPDEISALIKNNNRCRDWSKLQVSSLFDPDLIHSSEFSGTIKIGNCQKGTIDFALENHQIGISNSRINTAIIGDNCAIHDVKNLSGYTIGCNCILRSIDELIFNSNESTDTLDSPKKLFWIDLVNECGGRKVAPFDGILPADAYLWATNRHDSQLMYTLLELTQKTFDSSEGTIGDRCVIKSTRIIHDVKIGRYCQIEGANSLKNLNINSTKEEPVKIGEGCILSNGFVQSGCRISGAVQAHHFVCGKCVTVSSGARVSHSFIGDNSTISCCEISNNLLFPAHEQHHNNSFLIASLVKGQSNIPAGATLGSNHNSRAADGELHTGRGFWPGLSSTIKHSSSFASYVLLAPGRFTSELKVTLPFSLVANDSAKDRLTIIPAYWWMYNMYALMRNQSKFSARDKRVYKDQHIEFDALAPDTIEEIINAREQLAIWAACSTSKLNSKKSKAALVKIGHLLLTATGKTKVLAEIKVPIGEIEGSKREVVILKPRQAYQAYGEMIHWYAVSNVVSYMNSEQNSDITAVNSKLSGLSQSTWENFGGQLVSTDDVTALVEDIKSGVLGSWDAIHERYDELWSSYISQKQRHAFTVLCNMLHTKNLSVKQWSSACKTALEIHEYIGEKVASSRKKDYDNPIRQSVFASIEEMNAVIGEFEDNAFVVEVGKEIEGFKGLVDRFVL